MLSPLTPGTTPNELESAAITCSASPAAVQDVNAPLETDPKPHPILALWEAGFEGEIIPIIVGEKAPSLPKWQRATITLAQLDAWVARGSSFGLRTRKFPCLDVDVTDPELITVIESVIWEVFGYLPKRTGRPPKFAVPFRTASPFKKMTLTLHDADGADRGKIEVLGDGQQYVVEGLHPTTKQPYTWSFNGTKGGVEVLASVGAGTLPILTPELISDHLVPALITKLGPLGFIVTLKAAGSSHVPVKQEDLVAASVEVVREAVAMIPNLHDVDRDDWRAMAYAIYGATAGSIDGFEIFESWSAKWDGNVSENNRAMWDSIKPPVRLGWSYIADRARSFGFNVAQYEFDCIAPGPTPLVALPTEGERIAALLHDPGAALMLEAESLADGELISRWSALEQAAEATDPADEIFQTLVLPAAHPFRGYRKPKQFCQLVDSQLRKQAGWLALDPQTRTLLLHAAFALVIGPSVEGVQPRLVTTSDAPPAYLVEELLPELGAAMLVGPPNTGKSFIAADLAARVAAGSDTFAGSLSITRHGPVLYFTSEDPEGLASRIVDWSAAHHLPTDQVYVFNGTPVLADLGRALEQLQAAFRQAQIDGTRAPLIIFDTFRDALGAADENDSGVTAHAVRVARTLGRMVGAMILLVAHPPHTDPTRVRGSTAVLAALDVSLSVRQDGKTITATVEKRRRGPKGVQYQWRLDVNGSKAVLHPGPDRTDDGVVSGNDQRDQDARLVAELLAGIASAEHPASSKQLNDALQANRAGMCDSSDAKNRGASARRSRGVQRAVELKWITPLGKGRLKSYIPGPEQPPTEAPPNLDDLEREAV